LGGGYFAISGVYNPSTADDPLPLSRFNGFGASSSNPSFSTRYSGRGNAAFVDGHVESFAAGEMKYKHIDLEN
jgi:prepilin-type processing-associated H-X9-DG protein